MKALFAWIRAAAGWIRSAYPWQQRLLAFALGGASTLALPPVHAVPVLWLCLPPLIWMLQAAAHQSRGGWRAFWLGWCYGFGYFLVGLYWISAALFTDIARWWFVLPFAAAGLPAFLALYPALACALTRWLIARGAQPVLVFALSMSAAELLRGYLFTGFPWNLVGYGWSAWTPVLQTASVVGVYGLGLLTLIAAGAPAMLATRRASDNGAVAFCLAGLLAFVLLGAAGTVRMARTPDPTGTQLRIVQPNIPQTEKWRADLRAEHFRELLALSASPTPGQSAPSLVVWPETAVTFVLGDAPDARAAIADLLPPGSYLATGSFRRYPGPARRSTYANSLELIDSQGAVIGFFDKVHLVPFGEYVPLRAWLPFEPIAAGATDLKPGKALKTLDPPGIPPFSPLICYEAIFPGKVTAERRRPAWLLNVTNDAWYGETAGPYQHLAIAAARAVEEGLPLIRAANTGISAVVTADGRIVARHPLKQRGVIDHRLPAPFPRPTYFAEWGILTYTILWCTIATLVGFIALSHQLRREINPR